MLTHTITETDYFLPDDGDIAKSELIKRIAGPGTTWIKAYSVTMPEIFEAAKKSDSNGIATHMLLDHTQAMGHTELPLLKDLALSLKCGTITVTTAGIGSSNKHAIFHWKSVVIEDPLESPWCLEGSTNFSKSGWEQGNSFRSFQSKTWADAFIKDFKEHRDWALKNEAHFTDLIYGRI